MECLHRRLVNTTFLVAGWLTLTGLQSRQPPRWLWLLRLLPLAAYLLVLFGAVLLLASSPTEQQVVEGFSVYVFFLQTAVILVVFVTRRRDLDGLDRKLEELGQWASCHSPASQRRILARIAFFVLAAVINLVLWLVYPIVIGNFTHDNYYFQMKFPDFMTTPSSYWFCMALQMAVVMLSCSLALTFDCCFFAWMSAVEFHLIKVRMAIERIDSRPPVKEAFGKMKMNDQSMTNLEFFEEENKLSFSITSSPMKKSVSKQPLTANEESIPDEQTTGGMDVFMGKVLQDKAGDRKKETSGFIDPATALRSADQHYSQITRLVDSINQLCGLPVLLTHAATMSNILFGLFAAISMMLQPAGSGQNVHVIGYFTYIFIFFVRITFYSYDGGNILEKHSALLAALADMDWLGLPETAKLRREALMQKASQPLCINALGVFVINKINVLNISSFVLTYLVIMIQMLSSLSASTG